MKISVVIPCYNEQKRIGKSLDKIIVYFAKKKYTYEIIVVDDGSKDKSIQIVKAKKNKNIKIFKNKQNYGKGYSVKRGMLKAKYPLVLFSDADLATPIAEIEKLIKQIKKGYDVAIASRNMKESQIETYQPVHRQIMGKLFSYLVKLIALRSFKDTQCGFKLFKKDVAKRIFQKLTLNRFAFDVEALVIAQKQKYRIIEVPVKWIDKTGSTINPLKDSIKMLKDLVIIRINSLVGKYK